LRRRSAYSDNGIGPGAQTGRPGDTLAGEGQLDGWTAPAACLRKGTRTPGRGRSDGAPQHGVHGPWMSRSAVDALFPLTWDWVKASRQTKAAGSMNTPPPTPEPRPAV